MPDQSRRDGGRERLAATGRALRRLEEQPRPTLKRTLGSPAFFAIVFSSIGAALYFSLAVIADRALGLTPVVFLVASALSVVSAMTYVEGASMHPERGGATVFARYAFNELWSFVAGWVLMLDYAILVAVCVLSATNYLAVFWAPLGRDELQIGVCLAAVLYIAIRNVRGLWVGRLRRLAVLAVANLLLLTVIIVIGFFEVFDLSEVFAFVDVHAGEPSWSDLLYAMTLASVAFVGLESASGLSAEISVGRRGLKRVVLVGGLTTLVIYCGMSLVALSSLPQVGNATSLSRNFLEDPIIGVIETFDPDWLVTTLKYAVGASAGLLLLSAANGAMLGISRQAYSLATNRQIPSAIGRLHPRFTTPYIAIAIAGVMAAILVLPADLELLIGIYAFGAMIAFTLAHVSVCVLRYREPDLARPYKVPLNVRIGGGELPIPSVIGAVLSAAGWITVVVFHEWARVVGGGWLLFGVVLYVIYRKTESKPVFKRVTVPEAALRTEAAEAEYGSILVPIFGRPLDDDIVQTAGRLAAEDGNEDGEGGAMIEGLWVFEIPMALPLDAALPQQRLDEARAALRRAKAVGEEYTGVQVATATVRARNIGEAIVAEAKRRGVEAIVMAAEEPTRQRGGALLGGRGGPRENFVGDVTKYVVTKAPCRVILTAPPGEVPRDGARSGNGAR
jgi:basic amino acid/polyamine antiporter, APA family